MAFYKVKSFDRFSRKNGISDEDLAAAAERVLAGHAEADLGAGLYKVRVARAGAGKSGGFRTLITHRSNEHCFFVYGFEKSGRANINDKEERTLKELAKTLGALSGKQIELALESGEFVPVEVENEADEEDDEEDDPG